MSKIGHDQLDAQTYEDTANLIARTSNTKVSRATKIPTHYKTNHKRMGRALIFNHTKVKGNERRLGTEKDKERLEKILNDYGFDVRIENDLKRKRIYEVLEEVAKEDHSNSDCFLLIVMSHGKRDQVYASDGRAYDHDELWRPFSGDKCPTLIGKPKLFFTQVCRGDDTDPGVQYQIDSSNLSLQSDEIDSPITYTIPTTADILLYFSTMLGYSSYRNKMLGSWFIQTICVVLEEYLENVNGIDLYEFLTAVNREVAYDYESIMNDEKYNIKKEMPNFISTLTKSFILKPKIKEEEYNYKETPCKRMSKQICCHN